jgi:hypothetical protein
MSQLLLLDSYSSDTGDLTVFERIFPEHIKRVCFIQGDDNITYGGYRHKSTKLALVCLSGNCRVNCKNTSVQEEFVLDSAQKCLLLCPEDWFFIDYFSNDAKLLVIANQPYCTEELVHEPC